MRVLLCLLCAGGMLAGAGGSLVGSTPAGADGTVGSPTPIPGTSTIYDVGCSSANSCFGVGFINTTPGEEPPITIGIVVPLSDGSPGTVVQVPGTSVLDGVACATATSCVAVGYDSVAGANEAVIVPIDDGVPGTAAATSDANQLWGAACPTSGACYAVGYENGYTQNGEGVVLTLSTDGSITGGYTVNGTSSLQGVACASATVCEAAGDSSSGVEGAVVSLETGDAVTVPGTFDLIGIACPAADSCLAAGSGDGGNINNPAMAAVVSLSGAGLTVVSPSFISVPAGYIDTSAWGVACTDASDCFVDGTAENASTYLNVGFVDTVSGGVPSTPDLASNASQDLYATCPPLASAGQDSDTCLVGGGFEVPYGQNEEVSEGQVTPVTLAIASAAPLLSITSVTVQEQNYPNGNWEAIPPTGAVDGNELQITVTVENGDVVDHDVEIAFTDTQRGGIPVPQLTGPASTNVPAASSLTLTYMWDTTGLAWDQDSSTLDPLHALKLTLLTGDNFDTVADTATQNVVLYPRPIVFVHGLLSSAATWSSLQAYIATAYPGWQTFAVNTMNTGGGNPLLPTNTIAQNAQQLAAYIQNVRTVTQAQHVDIVAHSMGGLISRDYIQDYMPNDALDGQPVVTHLVMLGTPNEGSLCATYFPIPFPAMMQNTPAYVALFDSQVTNQRGVAFSVLAGIPDQVGCSAPGDGAVTVASALYTYTDTAVDPLLLHTAMTSSVSAFESFVKPHLIALPDPDPGPGSNAFRPATDVSTGTTVKDRTKTTGTAAPSTKSDRPATSDPTPEILTLQNVTIPVAGSVDISIPVSQPQQFGALFMAPGSVSSRLINPAGAVEAATSDVTTTDAFPLHEVGPVTSPAAGSWTLELTNDGSAPATAIVSAWEIGDPLNLDLQTVTANSSGQVEIVAQLTDDDAPVTDATVTATLQGLNGESQTLNLVDPGSGSYTGTTTPLAPDAYQVLVTAVGNGFSRTVTGFVNVTSTPQPPATNPGQVPPSAPLGLTATDGQITLNWVPPVSTGGGPVSSYEVFRFTSNSTASEVAAVASPATSYVDTNVAAGVTYSYYVEAVNQFGVSPPSNIVSVTASSGAPSGACSSYTANAAFVCALYEDLLGRPPDPGGLNSWLAALSSGVTTTQVAYAIANSAEFTTDYIASDYEAFLGRPPDPGGLSAFLQAFEAGASLEQIDASILGSAEFFADSGSTNNGFINAVYQDLLGRPADPGGLATWDSDLSNGVSRTQVAYAIDTSNEHFVDGVQLFYKLLLGRSADPGGISTWVGVFQSGATIEQVLAGIGGSQEFYGDATDSSITQQSPVPGRP